MNASPHSPGCEWEDNGQATAGKLAALAEEPGTFASCARLLWMDIPCRRLTSTETELAMVKKRIGDPWMPAPRFGHSLGPGVGVNLLVPDVAEMTDFCRDVLGAEIVYADEDFAAATLAGSTFMLHADHTYRDHEMIGAIPANGARGAGVEIRIYGIDPDAVEARARRSDALVLSGSIDKPHGLRECHIVGPNGYVFVPSMALKPVSQ
jgi:catechol 2,3-dioxygenase-like lactoylglutathione lyase family enzyme